mmetsp:Transcript_7384/g.15943  ORF Transcript_7384/g.15943 Transcript_7384/m.15943 type:complete len:283 (-) Transcript_7384:178-1026(-)
MASSSSSGQPKAAPASPASFQCGIAAGFFTTALLNPWDRALYLAIVNGRPFFSRANWREPYRGITQTLTQRSLSTGIYFPLEELCVRATGSQALGGQAGGVLCGVLLNPLSYVKYQMWKEDDVRRSFNQTAMRMLRKVGPMVFLRGIISTAFRDGTFGLCFSLRKFFQGSGPEPRSPAHDFCVAVLFAAAGTTLSAPFNYIRNMAYAESLKVGMERWPDKTRFWRRHMGTLWHGAVQQESVWASAKFLQTRMQLGWGTARVAFGMALTDFVYNACKRAQLSS